MSMMSNAGTLWGDHVKPVPKQPPNPAPAVRHDAPETSKMAARDTAPHSKVNRERILATIKAAGPQGMTCYEVQVALGMLPQTASARFTELKRLGWIEATGAKRETNTGSKAAAYRATVDGGGS